VSLGALVFRSGTPTSLQVIISQDLQVVFIIELLLTHVARLIVVGFLDGVLSVAPLRLSIIMPLPHSIIISLPHSIIMPLPHSIIMPLPHSIIMPLPHSIIMPLPHSIIMPLPHLLFSGLASRFTSSLIGIIPLVLIFKLLPLSFLGFPPLFFSLSLLFLFLFPPFFFLLPAAFLLFPSFSLLLLPSSLFSFSPLLFDPLVHFLEDPFVNEGSPADFLELPDRSFHPHHHFLHTDSEPTPQDVLPQVELYLSHAFLHQFEELSCLESLPKALDVLSLSQHCYPHRLLEASPHLFFQEDLGNTDLPLFERRIHSLLELDVLEHILEDQIAHFTRILPRTLLLLPQNGSVPLGEIFHRLSDGIAGFSDTDRLQHPCAPKLLAHIKRIKVSRRELGVGLDTPDVPGGRLPEDL